MEWSEVLRWCSPAFRGGGCVLRAACEPGARRGEPGGTAARRAPACFSKRSGSDLDPGAFAPVYVGSLRFAILPACLGALERLRQLGLELAVVANWDLSLRRLLEETRLAGYFGASSTRPESRRPTGCCMRSTSSASSPRAHSTSGTTKPDEEAALSAGMRFAPAPLSDAVAPARMRTPLILWALVRRGVRGAELRGCASRRASRRKTCSTGGRRWAPTSFSSRSSRRSSGESRAREARELLALRRPTSWGLAAWNRLRDRDLHDGADVSARTTTRAGTRARHHA